MLKWIFDLLISHTLKRCFTGHDKEPVHQLASPTGQSSLVLITMTNNTMHIHQIFSGIIWIFTFLRTEKNAWEREFDPGRGEKSTRNLSKHDADQLILMIPTNHNYQNEISEYHFTHILIYSSRGMSIWTLTENFSCY